MMLDGLGFELDFRRAKTGTALLDRAPTGGSSRRMGDADLPPFSGTRRNSQRSLPTPAAHNHM